MLIKSENKELKSKVQFWTNFCFFSSLIFNSTNIKIDMLMTINSTMTKLGSTAFQPCMTLHGCREILGISYFKNNLSRCFPQTFYQNNFFKFNYHFIQNILDVAYKCHTCMESDSNFILGRDLNLRPPLWSLFGSQDNPILKCVNVTSVYLDGSDAQNFVEEQITLSKFHFNILIFQTDQQ